MKDLLKFLCDFYQPRFEVLQKKLTTNAGGFKLIISLVSTNIQAKEA
jgi:hypothetical protein